MSPTPSLPPKTYARFSSLIFEKTGIQLSADRRGFFEARLAARLGATGISTPEAYYDFLWFSEKGDNELTALVESVLVNETFFFRSPQQLEKIRGRLLPALLAATDGEIRIWSAGCATGEEPYTLAILCEKCLPASRPYSILATDISTRALTNARRGVYSGRSLKNLPPDCLARYFEPVNGGFQVCQRIRDRVTFRYLNLTDQLFPRGWNLVVCRNVLYYFPDRTRRHIVGKLHEAIEPGGFLVVSSSENLRSFPSLFQAEGEDGSVFYRKWSTDRRSKEDAAAAADRRRSVPPPGIVRRDAASPLPRIALEGVFDLNDPDALDGLEHELLHALPAQDEIAGQVVRVDLTAVPYLSNTALDVLLRFGERIRAARGNPELAIRDGEMERWMRKARIASVFRILAPTSPKHETLSVAPAASPRPRGEVPAGTNAGSDAKARSAPGAPSFECVFENAAFRLTVRGVFDLDNHPVACERLVEEIKPLIGKRFLLDLRGVGFLPSEAAPILRRAGAAAREHGGRMITLASEGAVSAFLRRQAQIDFLTDETDAWRRLTEADASADAAAETDNISFVAPMARPA